MKRTEFGPEFQSTEACDLQSVLDAWRFDASVLDRYGHDRDAALIRRFCSDVAGAADDWLVFLSETDAAIKSGRSAVWLRSRFAAWERAGHARKVGGHRQYRDCVVPQGRARGRVPRGSLEDVREDARQRAREGRA